MATIEHLEWKGLEFEYFEKDSSWYMRVGIIGAVVIIISLLMSNLLLAAFALFSTLSVLILGAKRPRMVHYAITKKGIEVGDTLYPYDNLESFWIREQDDVNKLVIKTESYLNPYLLIPLGDIKVTIARSYLHEYLDEEEHRERFSERLSEFIRL